MYAGYLDSFYEKNKDIKSLSYNAHYNKLLNETTEFVGSYTRGFKKLGMDAHFIVANDSNLQAKWSKENLLIGTKREELLYNQVRFFQPDILWIDNLSLVDLNWLKSIRIKVKSIKLIVGYHCSPYGARILDTLKGVDFVFTCTPGLKSEMDEAGLRTYLIYHAFDETLIPKVTEKANHLENDFVFSGSLISGAKFHDERIKLIENILKGKIDISLYVNLERQYKIKAKQSIYYVRSLLNKLKLEKLTNSISLFEYGKTRIDNYSELLLKSCQNPVYGLEMYNLFTNSKVVLNMHIGVAGAFAGNMRLFEVTGTGSCLMTDNKKNLRDLFDTDNEIVVYDNAEDCVNKVRWLLEHETDRKRIATAGQKRTLKFHTVENRCVQIKEILDRELSKK